MHVIMMRKQRSAAWKQSGDIGWVGSRILPVDDEVLGECVARCPEKHHHCMHHATSMRSYESATDGLMMKAESIGHVGMYIDEVGSRFRCCFPERMTKGVE